MGFRGSALVGVQRGEAPLKLELFLNQNCPESHQLTRMVVTHTITCRGGGGEENKRGKKRGGGKSEFRQKSEKRHPCIIIMLLKHKNIRVSYLHHNTDTGST